ncbi:hypothetical protein PHJA_002185100 [Phtheirospermum japonicum]|uniref:Uncharacterized protein n=1 Tax=Phtheirospermum japonicum TaxID=374723 RepID=A0A830CKS3_9LAMI|nr:hypothetical protein PHJA_002185100 [Phtheirospermum japonicum]
MLLLPTARARAITTDRRVEVNLLLSDIIRRWAEPRGFTVQKEVDWHTSSIALRLEHRICNAMFIGLMAPCSDLSYATTILDSSEIAYRKFYDFMMQHGTGSTPETLTELMKRAGKYFQTEIPNEKYTPFLPMAGSYALLRNSCVRVPEGTPLFQEDSRHVKPCHHDVINLSGFDIEDERLQQADLFATDRITSVGNMGIVTTCVSSCKGGCQVSRRRSTTVSILPKGDHYFTGFQFMSQEINVIKTLVVIGEHQMSAAVAKWLYALKCERHQLFDSLQQCQLKYVDDTNNPISSELFNHRINMDCHKIALEIRSPPLDHLIATWSLLDLQKTDTRLNNLGDCNAGKSRKLCILNNLQDFMVGQRGGIMHPQRIPQDHVLCGFARSPLVVLFELMLPLIDYGTTDSYGDVKGEHHLSEPV